MENEIDLEEEAFFKQEQKVLNWADESEHLTESEPEPEMDSRHDFLTVSRQLHMQEVSDLSHFIGKNPVSPEGSTLIKPKNVWKVRTNETPLFLTNEYNQYVSKRKMERDKEMNAERKADKQREKRRRFEIKQMVQEEQNQPERKIRKRMYRTIQPQHQPQEQKIIPEPEPVRVMESISPPILEPEPIIVPEQKSTSTSTDSIFYTKPIVKKNTYMYPAFLILGGFLTGYSIWKSYNSTF